MKFVISNKNKNLKNLKKVIISEALYLFIDEEISKFSINSKMEVYIHGKIIGLKDSLHSSYVDFSYHKLGEIIKSNKVSNIKKCVEGNYIIIKHDKIQKCLTIFSDGFSQSDIYYQNLNTNYSVASEMSLFEESPSSSGYDQIGLAHSINVYGFRPAKKHTIYNNVKRLGLREYFIIKDNDLRKITDEFKPSKILDYGDKELNEYSDIFLDAVKIRSKERDNIVYLSSGWDSTSILAALIHLHGPKNVKAVIGEMKYSERAGVINPFEVSRAKAVADYYKVDLDVIPFDLTRTVPSCLEHLKSSMKSHFINSGTLITHGILAEYVSSKYGINNNVFAGEISDGVHNFGFSQFASIFHPVQDFREYSDKMLNYIYGPTFLKSFQNGTYKDDLIYKIFSNQYNGAQFDEYSNKGHVEKNMQILSSFYLRKLRFPLCSLKNNKLLTADGREKYSQAMEQTYLKEASEKLNQENYYSIFIDLYNSFHWQGATVSSLALTSRAYGFEIQLPFYDTKLQDFLSKMPEHFGRGLDFNPTKYPLKWMLRNRIDYPNHLQVGPHSYLYDVDHSFNHAIETWYHSAMKNYFQSILKERQYREILSDKVFNIAYLDKMVDGYLKNERMESGSLESELGPITYMLMSGIL